MDDESVELFEAQRREIAEHGGPASWLRQHLAELGLNGLVMFASMLAAMILLGSFPRNSDNSIKFAFAGPVLVAFAVAAALALRSSRLKRLPIRYACWSLILLAAVYVPVALLELARSRVS